MQINVSFKENLCLIGSKKLKKKINEQKSKIELKKVTLNLTSKINFKMCLQFWPLLHTNNLVISYFNLFYYRNNSFSL